MIRIRTHLKRTRLARELAETLDLSPEFDGLTLNTIRELAKRIADEYIQ